MSKIISILSHFHPEQSLSVEWEVVLGHGHDQPAGEAQQVANVARQNQGGLDESHAGGTLKIDRFELHRPITVFCLNASFSLSYPVPRSG